MCYLSCLPMTPYYTHLSNIIVTKVFFWKTSLTRLKCGQKVGRWSVILIMISAKFYVLLGNTLHCFAIILHMETDPESVTCDK